MLVAPGPLVCISQGTLISKVTLIGQVTLISQEGSSAREGLILLLQGWR